MKKKTIKQTESKVEIDTSEEKKIDSSFDSENFDKIPLSELLKVFESKYNLHKNAILDIVISRLAMSTAISNIEKSISEAMENPLVLDTDKTNTALDSGFTLALLSYGYNDAFKFIEDDEFRKDVMLTLITGNTKKYTKTQPPVGYLNKGSGEEIEKDLSSIRNSLTNKLERDSDSPYGDLTGSKVGILGKRSK